MTEPRRSFLAALVGAIAAIVASKRTVAKDAPASPFSERTPPGNRFRKFALGAKPLYVREDLFRSGWLGGLTRHDREEEP